MNQKVVIKKCSKCNEEKSIHDFHKNKDGFLGRRSNCKKCCSKYRRSHYVNNTEKSKLNDKRYRENNLDKNRAKRAKYRATKLQATPTWFDKDKVDYVYKKAQEWGFHVDHIIPLQGKNVCGLHTWENLQLLSSELNLKKGNR